MAYPGPGQRRRRRRTAPIALGVVVVLVALAAVVGVIHVRDDRARARKRSQAQAVAVTKSFLAAWAKSDTAAMTANATPASAALIDSRIPTLKRSLSITSALYVPGAVSSTKDPGAPFSADVVIQGLGQLRYASRLTLQKVNGDWKVAFSDATIYPGLTSDEHLVRERTLGKRGQLVLADGTPVRGQSGELDGNMLGTVGAYTAAQAQAAGPRFLAGDVGGLTGLERGYNTTLAGTPGGTLTIRDAAGHVVKTLIRVGVRNGRNVALSFNIGVQKAAEAALAGVSPNLTASLVAIDTNSGKVLAAANHPYNGFGRAIRGRYAPGSTFKIVTTLAALMSGKTPSTSLACTPTANIGGRTFGNAEGESYGNISLRTAFAKSCNTAFVRLGSSLPTGALGKAAALLGFGEKDSVPADTTASGPLPLTSFGGNVPNPTDLTDRAAESIGQGRIVTSPLQLASVAAAIAAGTWRQPFVSASPPAGNPAHALPAGAAATIRSFMAEVVSSGTAAGSALPPGTFGKTGTAEVGTATPPFTTAWFVGFRGNIAFACQVGDATASGGFGADTAAPAVARFLRAVG